MLDKIKAPDVVSSTSQHLQLLCCLYPQIQAWTRLPPSTWVTSSVSYFIRHPLVSLRVSGWLLLSLPISGWVTLMNLLVSESTGEWEGQDHNRCWQAGGGRREIQTQQKVKRWVRSTVPVRAGPAEPDNLHHSPPTLLQASGLVIKTRRESSVTNLLLWPISALNDPEHCLPEAGVELPCNVS